MGVIGESTSREYPPPTSPLSSGKSHQTTVTVPGYKLRKPLQVSLVSPLVLTAPNSHHLGRICAGPSRSHNLSLVRRSTPLTHLLTPHPYTVDIAQYALAQLKEALNLIRIALLNK